MTSKSLLSSLSELEWTLYAETEPAALAGLDEDELVDLHGRVRRARGKYQGQYRRGAAVRVAEVGGRGAARPRNRRAADKAELFEEALARVSTALARAARASAAELRAERLAAARTEAPIPPSARSASGASRVSGTARAKGRAASTRSPIAAKNVASSQAAGARRQARRDAAGAS